MKTKTKAKAKAKAYSNIAFIKYWGKRNASLRIPVNSSISMNLSSVYTLTSVEFDEKLKDDKIKIDGSISKGVERERVIKHLNRIRKIGKFNIKANVISRNNFPKGTGIASSASGFAALTVAAVKAAGINISQRRLSTLARLGSGSACRSIPDGFVEWRKGKGSESSYAYSIYLPNYWEIRDIIAIVGERKKKVSSSEGHKLVSTSPFFKSRMQFLPKRIQRIKRAFRDKDFTDFGKTIEEEALNMHAVMMTSKPALFYWLPDTIGVMNSIIQWREQGLESYFTLDAGPNVHVICEERNSRKLTDKLRAVKGVKQLIVNKPSIGARLVG